jgi:outer membrane protein assembly factor BamB
MQVRKLVTAALLLSTLVAWAAPDKNEVHVEDAFAALVGRGGTIARSDVLEDTAKRARKAAPRAPQPAWETTFPHEVADLVQFIDEDRVVVGAVEIGALQAVPDFKGLIAYDPRSGKKLWEAARDRLRGGRYAIVAIEPSILLLGISEETLKLTAIAPASGERLWSTSVRKPVAHAVSGTADRVYVVAGARSRDITAIDAGTGRSAWSEDLPGKLFGRDVKRISLHVKGNAVYAAGAGLVRMAADTGKMLWTVSLPELQGEAANLAPVDDGVLVWSASSMALLDASSGEVRWRNEHAPGRLRVVVRSGPDVMRVLGVDAEQIISAGSGWDRAQAIDLKTGAVRWSRPLAGTVVGQPAIENGLVLLSLEHAVVALDAASGEVRFRSELPAPFRAGSPAEYNPAGQADILTTRDGKLFVSRESMGIAAFSLADGKALWRHSLHVERPTGYPLSTPSKVQRLKATLALHKVKLPQPPTQQASTALGQQPSLEVQRLREEYRALDAQARAARAAGDRREYVRITNAQVVNLRSEQNQARIDSSFALGSAALGSAISFIDALQRDAVDAALARISMEIDYSVVLHQSAFQGRFYLRPFHYPFIADGLRGITIVDLDSGKRSDAIVSPHVPVLDSFGIDMPQIAVDPSGARLITVGVGLRPERYEPYVAWKVRQARPSVLAFDIGSLRFEAEAVALETRIGKLRPQSPEERVAHAVKTANLVKLQRMLDSGADVDTRDQRGYTALMMAAEMDSEPMVRLLLSRGADANASARGLSVRDVSQEGAVRRLLDDAVRK